MIIKILANADSFKRGMNQANGYLKGFQNQIRQFKSMFAAAFSASILIAFGTGV